MKDFLRIGASILVLLMSGCSPRESSTGAVAPIPAEAGSQPTAPREEWGKAIYRTGISPSGRSITARLGEAGADVPAAVLTCGNCHGHDGIGKREGGVTPATITWDELTSPYGPSHPSGRHRPAYDDKTVRRAITMGLDPSGRVLDPAMPRYALTHEDLDDLVAYLKKLGRDPDPGLTDQGIVVGTILPPSPSLGEMSRAVAAVLAAYFAEVNDRGGIFGRRVELKSEAAPEAAGERAAAGRRVLERQEVFAMVAAFVAGDEGPITEAAREQKVPIVGPFTLFPQVGHPLNRYVFYLQSGLADQGRALAVFADRRLGGRKPAAAVLFQASDEMSRASAELIRAECRRLGWSRVELMAVSRGAGVNDLVGRMLEERPDVVFDLLSEGREIEFLTAAGSRDWEPLLLIPGALAGKDILRLPPRFRHRLFLSFPTLPLDNSREGAAEYERLAVANKLPQSHRSSQVTALIAAKVFVEAMTAAGRAASRETLIEQLERFYQKPTGLSPPITFGPNRRIGARGAYIVEIDPENAKLVPVSGFIEPSSP